jgi:CRP-like cAMP-binding protein
MQPHDLAISQVQRVLHLGTFTAFRGLSSGDLSVIAEHAKPRYFPRGSTLLRPGFPVQRLYFIVRGQVDILRDGVPHRIMGAQDVVGGLAALTGDREGQHVVARSDAVTLELERDDMEDVFEDNFRIFVGVLRAIARAELALRRGLGEDAGYETPRSAEPSRQVGRLDLVERIFFLRQIMSYAKTRIEALADLAQEARELDLPTGRLLWQPGDVADHSVMLIGGLVACQSGDERQRFRFGPGAIVGGLESVASEPRWYSAIAETRIRALSIDAQSLLDVVEDNMEIATDMLRVHARALRDLGDRISYPPEQPIA